MCLTRTPSPCSNPFSKLMNKSLTGVGRTVLSFRIAAEIERTKWKQFRSLLDRKDRKMFDEMYDCFKLHNTACMMACRPVVIHAVLMSIIFEHYKQLTKLMTDWYRKSSSPKNVLILFNYVFRGKVLVCRMQCLFSFVRGDYRTHARHFHKTNPDTSFV